MKKLYAIIVFTGLATIGIYLAVHYWLRSEIQEEQKEGFIIERKDSVRTINNKNAAAALDLRPAIITRLQQLVKKGSNGLYDLTMDSIQIDVLQSEVILFQPKLSADFSLLPELEKRREAPEDVFQITLSKLFISGINVDDFLNRKNITLNLITIADPIINVYHNKGKMKQKKESNESWYERIAQLTDRISIKGVLIKKGVFLLHDLTEKRKPVRLNDVAVRLSDIVIDSQTKKDKNRFLFAKEALITIRNFATSTKDNLYTIHTGAVTISPNNKRMEVTDITLLPKYNKQEFQKRIKHMQEWYHLVLPQAVFTNVQWWKVLQGAEVHAERLTLSSGKLYVYLDRSHPVDKTSLGSYPHQLLMKLPWPIQINNVKAKNIDLVYEELNPTSGKTGKVYFHNLELSAKNVTNIPDVIMQNRWATVSGSALFLNTVPVKADFKFDLRNYRKGNFLMHMNMSSMDGKIVNSIAEPLGLFSIKSGVVKKATATVRGNNDKTEGDVLLLYNDLKVSVLEKDKG
ncbi:MAG: hypothetical protein ICV84_09305, partial [Flavisolibacter sp.]|nr:hypothetical protein [Flavisolibacter sp.]